MRSASTATRRFLCLAAAFNLGAALAIALLARHAPDWLGLDPVSASQRMYVDLCASVIASFGLGYGLAGFDLPRFWPFIALGALAKVLVVLIVVVYFFIGAAGLLPLTLVIGDALFAVAFIHILRHHAEGVVHE